ncbi:MAG TPA: bifunctional adenosylcobinamide kinase/adenosylcobinamide-phosphate guanylyltransferase, partial [Novosphingobium sp.]|nr:bifunctional adenosylcobinamide kinase/adenosylcobinamide-phosphate guanylyltransferase [Novosphingobium sp.]
MSTRCWLWRWEAPVPERIVPPSLFVIGGARSGKSRYAESLITALSPPWLYVATAE